MKRMTKSTLLSSLLVMGMLSLQSVSAAELSADITVFQNNQGAIAPQINFPTAESGDLYLAFRVNGEGAYYFLTSTGAVVQQATAYATLNDYVGDYTLPQFNTASVANGRYQLYMVMVNSGSDVYDVNNWIGGLSGLQKLNFSLGGAEIADLDSNGDGWFDDDLNKDGFHDSDSNFDGWYDDDLDRDGYPDGNSNTLNTTSSTSNNDSGTTSNDTATTSDSISSGLATYTSYCVACHGTDPTRNRDGILAARSAAATARAIQRNEGGMGFLDFLSDTDLQDIADYINSL